MRSMTRNRQKFYSARLLGTALGQDSNGNYTEQNYSYSNPEKHEAVISVANGEAQSQYFGMDEIYDKVITLNQGENYLEIGSVLWVDTMPDIDEETGETATPYDYYVVKAVKSLNIVIVAIRKVDVS